MIAEHVADHINDNTALVEGTDLFVDLMPEEPDECVMVQDRPAPPLPEGDAYQVDMLACSITCRGSYAQASARIKELHKLLVAFNGQLGGEGPQVTGVMVGTPPSSLGRDGKDRARYTAHYWIRAESTGGDAHRI